jgi:hypothetical protein
MSDQRRWASQDASPGRSYVGVIVVIGILIVDELSSETASPIAEPRMHLENLLFSHEPLKTVLRGRNLQGDSLSQVVSTAYVLTINIHTLRPCLFNSVYRTNTREFDSRWDHTILFNWSNPSSRTMVLGSTQPLTEMSTRNLLGV